MLYKKDDRKIHNKELNKVTLEGPWTELMRRMRQHSYNEENGNRDFRWRGATKGKTHTGTCGTSGTTQVAAGKKEVQKGRPAILPTAEGLVWEAHPESKERDAKTEGR